MHKDKHSKQKGFAFLLIIVVIAIVTSLWISTRFEYIISFFKSYELEERETELTWAKDRLLQYAVLHPEVYLTDSSNAGQSAESIPAPGYFPCPDLDGDGDINSLNYETQCQNSVDFGGDGFVPDPDLAAGLGSCNGTDLCLGYLPRGISERHLYFAEQAKYYYFLDERFAFRNGDHAAKAPTGAAIQYIPMNPSEFNVAGSSPVLSINGKTGYVVVLIDPGLDGQLNGENADGDGDFQYNPLNSLMNDADNTDVVIGIHYDEWLNWVARRVCSEHQRFDGGNGDENNDGNTDAADEIYTGIDETIGHWFNDYDLATDRYGADWRGWVSQCPEDAYPQ
ncbi:hypothetical protein [Thiomicrorhabdus sediminis]|uniref:Uncharacterized protein n=1 Tax=Thiomicrorhabdus sediminis TaxID=2580412 RepID=A0A4P9K6T2_9GAMM|nr:hypothetical protein [Thiomicrorhabdus sediminis]QCU90782.1 hypothetical protein FE785_09150 [Thiomicrorhabdus sediminis]